MLWPATIFPCAAAAGSAGTRRPASALVSAAVHRGAGVGHAATSSASTPGRSGIFAGHHARLLPWYLPLDFFVGYSPGSTALHDDQNLGLRRYSAVYRKVWPLSAKDFPSPGIRHLLTPYCTVSIGPAEPIMRRRRAVFWRHGVFLWGRGARLYRRHCPVQLKCLLAADQFPACAFIDHPDGLSVHDVGYGGSWRRLGQPESAVQVIFSYRHQAVRRAE